MIIVNRVSTKTHQVDATSGTVTTQKSTEGAAHANIRNIVQDDTKILPYARQIYSGSVTGNSITTALTDYTDWSFNIFNVDATGDDVTIQVDLGDANFVDMGVLNVATNTFVAAGAVITVPGIYKFAAAAGVPIYGLVVEQIKVTRPTATGSNPVTVYATAKPVN